ncbi:hypothetical protein CF15_05920 [Pyrodictium occultum]|uniref:Uncharacterized protein n=1 Tax=Pyrodictium occultum TaxID=2309 RepID=A0A0V8RW57_PYROC|nr:hypothetical protein CF15_05920 [Pyrodictium occultum]
MPVPRVPLKDLGFAILLLALIPSLILYSLGLHDGLIATLIYFQLVTIWIQAEISLRQQELAELQATPITVLHYSSSRGFLHAKPSEATKHIPLTVQN